MGVMLPYFKGLAKALDDMPEAEIDTLFSWMKDAYEAENQIFVMGNGGSAATASHFAVDINKGVSMNLQKKFRMIALNDNQPTLTAYANDLSYDDVFAKLLENYIRPGDLIIGISTSGNSKNVIKAIELAKKRGNRTACMTGKKGGAVAKVSALTLRVPTDDVQLAEDLHMSLCHMYMRRFCEALDTVPAGKE